MFNLSASVGSGGANASADVLAAQKALARLSDLAGDDGLDPGGIDGKAGDGFVGAVAHLQRVYLHARKPDGRIDPGGLTAATLARLSSIYAYACECVSPVDGDPERPYHGRGAGPRAYRSSRSKGRRAHAGDDLYRPVGTPVRAIAPGRVGYVGAFYLRTDEIQVHHDLPGGGTFVVRYGEVKPSVKPGQRVERGEKIGTVGQMILKSGKRFHLRMLHIELYTGLASGALTDRSSRGAFDRIYGRPFRRRRDLVDVTPLLRRIGVANG